MSARAVDGAATEAALAALADAVGLRRRHVILVTGATSRTKVVEVRDDEVGDEVIAQRIERLRTGVGA